MDIGRAFTYMFDDEKWVEKLVIGGLLVLASIIPVVNLFTALVLAGYTLRILRRVSRGEDLPLPEWDDWGGDWMRGLMIAVASLIYAFPILILVGLSSLFGAIGGYEASGQAISGIAGLCVAATSCLSALWGLAIAVVFPAAMINYANVEEFASFFRFGEIFRFIGDNLEDYIVAILLLIVAGIVSSFGVIACGIGVFFTSFWGTLVGVHLLGQVSAIASSAPGGDVGGELESGATGEV
ncbi:MAG: DUF4013 domain-containing protein [Chloroflexota bacterium]|nr:DUF4013 domain-containing protein [Chloroflexota bacterium]